MVSEMGNKSNKIEPVPAKKEIKKYVISFRCSEKHYQMIKDNAKNHGYKNPGTWALFAALNFRVPK